MQVRRFVGEFLEGVVTDRHDQVAGPGDLADLRGGGAVRPIRDEIKRRVETLLAELVPAG